MEVTIDQPTAPTTTTIIIPERKNVGVALLLTFLFGPLGLLYTTVKGALIMIGGSFLFSVLTLGFGTIIVLALAWPVSVVWSLLAANAYNRQVDARLSSAT